MKGFYRIFNEYEDTNKLINIINFDNDIDKNYILAYKKHNKSIIYKSFKKWKGIIQSIVAT